VNKSPVGSLQRITALHPDPRLLERYVLAVPWLDGMARLWKPRRIDILMAVQASSQVHAEGIVNTAYRGSYELTLLFSSRVYSM
jgi:hypothetical protein